MIQKIQRLFERVVGMIEDNPTPLPRYFGLFFALLAVRLCLEFFSSHRLFTMADVIHISLWFVFIVLAFLLQLHLFSGVSLGKVTKLVVVCFSIALTAPIIDLILNGGVGAKMNYLSIPTWKDAVFSYFTVGGASLSRGATLGIRIEIVLLVIASFNYVRTKRNSILWGLISAVSIYTVLFFSGTIPKLLSFIVAEFDLKYALDDHSTLLLLLCLDLVLLGIALARYAPNTFWKMLKAGAWGGFLPAIFLFLHWGYVSTTHYPENWALNPTTLFWFPLLGILAIVFMALTGYHRIQYWGLSTSKNLQRAGNFLKVLSLVIAVSIGEQSVFALGVPIGLMMLLYEQPLVLARAPFIRNLLESMLLASFGLLGWIVFGGPMVGFPHQDLVVLILLQMAGLFYRDLVRFQEKEFSWYRNGLQGHHTLWRWVFAAMLVMAMVLGTLYFADSNWNYGIGIVTGLLAGFTVTQSKEGWTPIFIAGWYFFIVFFQW